MKVAIVGFETEGTSALHYWLDQGAEVTVCDQDPQKIVPPEVATQLGDGYLNDLSRFDVIMRSAGIPPRVLLEQNPGIEGKVTTVINEFLRVSPTKNIIGVTGTKGKGTTCTLTMQMLAAAGHEVFLGGNIGLSPFDFLPKLTADSWVVLELSSFQLIDIQYSPHIAVCLMVVPEHLNWHSDMTDYAGAKAQLFAHQQPDDIAIYYADNTLSHEIASNSPGKKISYLAPPGAYVENGVITIDNQEICRTGELQLLGQFNWQNACAAVTAFWQVVQSPDAARKVLTTFTGLPHRLEFVREINDVEYYDDSFGTTPETAMVAIEAFTEPKIVILGGSDKGAPFDQLARTVVDGNVRKVIAIGETAPKIIAELQAAGYANDNIIPGARTMDEIVQIANREAQPGDIVLLSTGCASFDLFANYKDRGNQFKQVVSNLV